MLNRLKEMGVLPLFISPWDVALRRFYARGFHVATN
jgi:hypothetical protein